MNITFPLLIALVVLASSSAARAEKRCATGEYVIFTSPSTKPSWTEQPSFSDAGREYFVGLSTQNVKIEDGIKAATEFANGALLENVGEVVQKKSEGLLTLDADDIRQSFGSKGAAAYFKAQKREAVYYERWVSQVGCVKSYYYNVWSLVSVPSGELNKEAEKAAVYLLNLQEEENGKGGTGLLPSNRATHIDAAPVKKVTNQRSVTTTDNGNAAPEQKAKFSCANISLAGGVNYPVTSFETNRGRFDKWGYNMTFEIEGGLTENICAGGGFGYLTLRKNDGGTGSIIPFPMRISAKFPIGAKNGLIFWFGGEVGVAILYGFSNKVVTDSLTGEQTVKKKAEAGFWSAAVAGVDIRLQKSLYLTINGGYVPIVAGNSFQFAVGRVGIRYYF